METQIDEIVPGGILKNKKQIETIIGILTFDRINSLRNCLTSVLKTVKGDNIKIVVASNSSNEEYNRQVQEMCLGKVITLFMKEDVGTCVAVNAVTRLYNSRYVALLNDDIIVYPYWLELLRNHLASDPKIATTSFTGPVCMDLSGSEGKLEVYESLYPTAAPFMFKREVFNRVGQFDTRFFMYYEEIDWGIRAVKLGYHHHSMSVAGRGSPRDHVTDKADYPEVSKFRVGTSPDLEFGKYKDEIFRQRHGFDKDHYDSNMLYCERKEKFGLCNMGN